MKRVTVMVAALLLMTATARALPPTNQEVEMQPDEIFPWACEFYVTIASVVGVATYLQGGTTGATCTGLLTGLQVNAGDTSQAIWTWTPGSLDATKTNVCWVHLLATDAFASKYGCDGKTTVRKNKPTS